MIQIMKWMKVILREYLQIEYAQRHIKEKQMLFDIKATSVY